MRLYQPLKSSIGTRNAAKHLLQPYLYPKTYGHDPCPDYSTIHIGQRLPTSGMRCSGVAYGKLLYPDRGHYQSGCGSFVPVGLAVRSSLRVRSPPESLPLLPLHAPPRPSFTSCAAPLPTARTDRISLVLLRALGNLALVSCKLL